ncbi:MAG: response regulator transcription factor [Chloroflexota bacterium]|nr:response regulator transcription factor [Chloroflexota bacterium]
MRILLADDHEIVRRGLQMVLSLEKDFEVVGEASSGAEAVARAKELRPDLVLMDLKMRTMDGAAATRMIKHAQPETRVLILTGIEADEEIMHALEAGADGYVLKEVSPDELIRAIRVIGAGEAYLQPTVTKNLIRKMHATPARAEATSQHPALTARECEILRLMATSATYREIAAQLVVSEETIRSHTKNILAKLGQPNRTQAVMLALREGLVDLD